MKDKKEQAVAGARIERPLRVLLVEASTTDAWVVQELERSGHRIHLHRVQTADAICTALEQPWDDVIADKSVPDLTGTNAFELVEQLQLDVPYIILSSARGALHAIDAISAGAHEYVRKDSGRWCPSSSGCSPSVRLGVSVGRRTAGFTRRSATCGA